MIIEVSMAECDGCRLRIQGTSRPNHWITVNQNDALPTMFCSATCYARGEGLSFEQIAQSRAERLGIGTTDLMVIGYLAEGLTNAEIGIRLYLSEATIKNRIHESIGAKLGTRTRLEIVLVAGHLGLIDLEEHALHLHLAPIPKSTRHSRKEDDPT